MKPVLRAPFPWFGGKSRVASLMWERFGDVPNYVEPFAGSLAVLLGRPHRPKTETVNDKDCYLANFWRALQSDPDSVAAWTDWPINEADLHARHWWLVNQDKFRQAVRDDPAYFDPKIAGWWVWGLSLWIGEGWCHVRQKLPHVGDAGRGVHRPSQKLPHVGDAGRGVHRPSQQLPHVGNAGRGVHQYMHRLAARIRNVRVCCGDWSRVMGESVTIRHGVTAVLLDPPYSESGHSIEYEGGGGVSDDVRAWAIEHGDNPLLRIALCGYAQEHAELESAGWAAVRWKARGGYGSQGESRGRENAAKETIWFSPHCLSGNVLDLFQEAAG